MIRLENIDVKFKNGDSYLHAVKDVNLNVDKGDIFGIIGFSGAGKSTLVRTINLIQKPSAGRVFIKDIEYTSLSERELREKRTKIGMIFQHFNLMSSRTIVENVLYPLKKSNLSKEEKNKKAFELLELVGISEKANNYPAQLSGGQKQRVAIARALANDPEILLCDEATSALDPKTTNSILELLKEINRRLGLTIVIITHEMQVIKEICTKVAIMESGKIIESGKTIDIFSNPKEDITKNFIEMSGKLEESIEVLKKDQNFYPLKIGEYLVRLTYVGESAKEAIISKIYSEYKVSTNIIAGKVEYIQDEPLGNLIVILEGNSEDIKEAINYIKSSGTKVDILESGTKEV